MQCLLVASHIKEAGVNHFISISVDPAVSLNCGSFQAFDRSSISDEMFKKKHHVSHVIYCEINFAQREIFTRCVNTKK